MAALDNLSVAELEAALKQKRDYLADLVERKHSLEKELASLNGEIAALGGKPVARRGRPPKNAVASAASPTKGKRRGAPRGPRPKNKLTMKQAVTKALTGAKGGLTVKETAAAVKKAGQKSKSGNFENVVYQCLFNNKSLFAKNSDGKYELK